MSSSPPPPADAAPATSDDDAASAPAPQIPDNRPSTQSTMPEGGNTPSAATDDDNSRRCFICLVDEADDDLPSDWVTPCTCTLEGHQSCLLAWVADLEMQRKSAKCPGCKSPIVIVDRWDPAVRLSDKLTGWLSGLSPWLLLTLSVGGVMTSSAVYGMHALHMFAGREAALRYVFRKHEAEGVLDALLAKLNKVVPFLFAAPNVTASAGNEDTIAMPPIDWVHVFNLSMIAPSLVLNRLHLSETVMIPVVMVSQRDYTQISWQLLIYDEQYSMILGDHKADMFAWPPSPGRAIATVTIAKTFYFRTYRSVSKKLDKKMADAASEPQNLQGETAEEADARLQVAPAPQPELDQGDEIHLDFDIQIGNGGNQAPENPPRIEGAQPARPDRLATGVEALLNYLAGTLLWPTVSYGAGKLLGLALPRPWVTKPSSGPVTGLLQQQWGRSLVGGCLFVVLKDAFFLYTKYRKSINRPYRRIRNVERRPR
jgi:hypothetical protein